MNQMSLINNKIMTYNNNLIICQKIKNKMKKLLIYQIIKYNRQKMKFNTLELALKQETKNFK